MLWQCSTVPASAVDRLRSELRISPRIARLLVKQGLTEPATAERFLHPRLADLGDPFQITHLEAAADRLVQALRADEKIAIVGDYDVDGVTSTALLVSILRHFGLAPEYFVPRRMQEGYGLTEASVERLLKACEPSLVIALDCGTNSVAEVAALRDRGIDVIIVDHHQSRDGIPQNCWLVNPHVFDAPEAPWARLCTAGLVFKLVHGLVKRLRQHGDPVAKRLKLKDYLDFVALGTVADLVPLREENRILTRFGLTRLSACPRQGMRALFEVSGMTLGQAVEPVDISFRLGPRINASGRLADAALPVGMLLSEDFATCNEAARQLEAFNRERQAIERRMVEEAAASISALGKPPAGLLVYGDDWHPGVVGIVAGKLAREFNRPCIALGRDGDLAVGSGRSCSGIDLQCVLGRCGDLLQEWGGHPMAVGITLAEANVSAFAEAFASAVAEYVSHQPPSGHTLTITDWVASQDLGDDLLNEMDMLRPFGEANPEPVLGVPAVTLRRPLDRFGDGHFRFQIPTGNGRPVAGIAWRKADNPVPVGEPVDLAVKFYRHHFNGRVFPQAELLDWRPSQGANGSATT